MKKPHGEYSRFKERNGHRHTLKQLHRRQRVLKKSAIKQNMLDMFTFRFGNRRKSKTDIDEMDRYFDIIKR